MKPLLAFASKFGGKFDLNPQFVVEEQQQYFLLSPALLKLTHGNFFSAGLFLGSVKENEDAFSPSFSFLDMIALTAANKITVDSKTSWLFICGRDVLKKGIAQLTGSSRIGDYVLVQNEYGECLGYGILANILKGASSNAVIVRNVLDIGDFLRRES